MKDGYEELRQEYYKKRIKRTTLGLNDVYDRDIIEHLKKVGNKTEYIENLIRADMCRSMSVKYSFELGETTYYVMSSRRDQSQLVLMCFDNCDNYVEFKEKEFAKKYGRKKTSEVFKS